MDLVVDLQLYEAVGRGLLARLAHLRQVGELAPRRLLCQELEGDAILEAGASTRGILPNMDRGLGRHARPVDGQPRHLGDHLIWLTSLRWRGGDGPSAGSRWRRGRLRSAAVG